MIFVFSERSNNYDLTKMMGEMARKFLQGRCVTPITKHLNDAYHLTLTCAVCGFAAGGTAYASENYLERN